MRLLSISRACLPLGLVGKRMQFQVCYLGYIEIQVVGSTILLEKAPVVVASLPFLLRDIGKMRNILRV